MVLHLLFKMMISVDKKVKKRSTRRSIEFLALEKACCLIYGLFCCT